jgi:heme-degrading monooxygenase HmoA
MVRRRAGAQTRNHNERTASSGSEGGGERTLQRCMEERSHSAENGGSSVDRGQSQKKGESEMTNFVLINPFEVPEDMDDDRFLEGWGRVADYMRSQPGFVGSQLHRAVSPSPRFRFVNVAEWESPQDFQAAVRSPEFQAMAADAPPNYPALYEVVRAF